MEVKMGVFDNYKEINGKVVDNSWIEWWHFLVPNKDNLFRKFMRGILSKFGHCLRCTVLDGCYFVKWNMPQNEAPNTKGLLHPKCDCKTKNIEYVKVEMNSCAKCSTNKFNGYIFGNNSKGKKALFESWGYNIEDTNNLIELFCKQAKDNYIKGNYKLKKLDKYGQRLAIPISLGNGKNFYSGWMLYPEGALLNTTPFSGRIK